MAKDKYRPDLEYWKKRCLAAEQIIQLSNIEPSFNHKLWEDWIQLKYQVSPATSKK